MESTRSSSTARQMGGRYQNHVARKRDEAIALKKSITEIREEPGSSNAGKYKGVKSFCGPAGGAAKGTYPVDTLKRAKSALKLAHNAPNPQGIKDCVYKKWPELKPNK